MKFDTLYNNLILEQDALPPQTEGDQASPQGVEQTEDQNAGAIKVPQPGNFDDVQPMPQIDTKSARAQLEQQITRLVKLSKEINGFEGPEQSIQQFVFSIEKPKGIYSGVSKEVEDHLTKAAGELLDAANKLSLFVISTDKRAQDLASLR